VTQSCPRALAGARRAAAHRRPQPSPCANPHPLDDVSRYRLGRGTKRCSALTCPCSASRRSFLLPEVEISVFRSEGAAASTTPKAKTATADSLEGSLAFMRSNPAPDGRFCLDLEGACARCATAVFGRASQPLVHCRLQRCAAQRHRSTGRRSPSRSVPCRP